jgi:hypothetical protein
MRLLYGHENLATWDLKSLHTMAEGREAVDFHQLDCKKSRFGLWTLPTRGESPNEVVV